MGKLGPSLRHCPRAQVCAVCGDGVLPDRQICPDVYLGRDRHGRAIHGSAFVYNFKTVSCELSLQAVAAACPGDAYQGCLDHVQPDPGERF